MASRAWTDADREYLAGLADRRDWIDDARRKFKDRSEAAVRCMMQKVRADLGTSDTRLVENGWMADAVNGSAMLLARLETTGLRP